MPSTQVNTLLENTYNHARYSVKRFGYESDNMLSTSEEDKYMADYGLSLAESIAALRDELHTAMAKMPQTGLLFRLAPIELTLEVVVTKVGEGKIGWQIVEAGGKYEKGRTQTLKLTLDPAFRDATGRLLENPYVSDTSQLGQHIGPRDESDDED